MCERVCMYMCVLVEERVCFSLYMGREDFWQNLRKSHGTYFEMMDYKKEKGGKELV